MSVPSGKSRASEPPLAPIERLYTFAQPDTPVEIVALRVDRGGRVPAGRQFRQLLPREHAERIAKSRSRALGTGATLADLRVMVHSPPRRGQR
jgi:hypothetical protein